MSTVKRNLTEPHRADAFVVDVHLTGAPTACLRLLETLHAQGFHVANASGPQPIDQLCELVHVQADVATPSWPELTTEGKTDAH